MAIATYTQNPYQQSWLSSLFGKSQVPMSLEPIGTSPTPAGGLFVAVAAAGLALVVAGTYIYETLATAPEETTPIEPEADVKPESKSLSPFDNSIGNPRRKNDQQYALIVDDDQLVLNAGARFLGRQISIPMEKGLSAEEGIAIIMQRGQYPNCVISDNHMPGMHGIDFLTLLRSSGMLGGMALVSGGLMGNEYKNIMTRLEILSAIFVQKPYEIHADAPLVRFVKEHCQPVTITPGA